MLSAVLLLKAPNTTTSLPFSKHSTCSKYPNEYTTKQYHSHTTNFNPPSPIHVPPSAVHGTTTSFNPFLFHHKIALPFCHLITKICQSLHSHSCLLFPPLGTNSRKYCDKYPTHPTNSSKPHLLPSLLSSFTPN